MPSHLLPAPRWLSFNCYGTLIDWESSVRRSLLEAAHTRSDEEQELLQTWERVRRAKMQGAYTSYARILQDSFRETLEHFGYRCAPHVTEAFLQSVANWEPFPDVNPALIRLAQRFRLAIVSNVDRDILGQTLRRLQVRFDALITAEDTRQYNPSPEVFRYALAKTNCTPQEMVYVAFSSEADLESAASAGVRVVYLDRGTPLGETKLPVEATIKNLNELAGLWH